MKYFLHDTNAQQDPKVAELFLAHGWEGVGLFYGILEKLALQEKPIKTSVLKGQLLVGKKLEKVWSLMEEIGLIKSENGETFSVRMNSYIESYGKAKEKNREKVSQWRENQQVPNSVTGYEQVRNAPNSIVSNSNNKKQTKKAGANAPGESDLFEKFFDAYDKKVDRKKSSEKFARLSLADQMAILENVPHYVKAHPNPKYRRSPLVYLNGENWKDPIVASTQTPGAKSEMVY